MRDKKEARQSFYRTCKIISHKLIWINILLLGYHKMTLNQFVKKKLKVVTLFIVIDITLNMTVVVKLQYQNQTEVKKTISNN